MAQEVRSTGSEPTYQEFVVTNGSVGANTAAVLSSLWKGKPTVILDETIVPLDPFDSFGPVVPLNPPMISLDTFRDVETSTVIKQSPKKQAPKKQAPHRPPASPTIEEPSLELEINEREIEVRKQYANKTSKRIPPKGQRVAATTNRFIVAFWVVTTLTVFLLLAAIAMAWTMSATPTESQNTVLQLVCGAFTVGFGAIVGLIGGKAL
jgi:hypothetical protein